ncbi:putative ribonuclease H-like domain-containing protein, partial [Tanacetum coccineum]
QEYEAKDAAARYGYLFSQEIAEILSQAEAEIRNQGIYTDRDPADINSAGSVSAGGNPAGGNPASSFQPAGSYEPADQGNPAVSTSVSTDFIPVHADESTLPPGQSLGSTPLVDVNPVPTRRVNTIHPQSQILGDLASPLEPTSIAKALEDSDWVTAMQEEMQQFINQKGHRQEEGIDYDEVFAPVARIEAIRLFLAFASYMGFLVYQLDVKSAFLYGEIEEEVYITQPKGFEDPYFPKHVYKVVKALYGLHQAPRAWYERLSAFLLQHNYRRGTDIG